MRQTNSVHGTTARPFLGTAGPDLIYGTDTADIIFGLSGSDTLFGEAGNDLLRGGSKSDTVSGGADDDTLSGGGGSDELDGGTGNDLVDGGRGDDVLTGGDGADVFAFTKFTNATATVGFGTDIITDLDLSGSEAGGDGDSVFVRRYGSFSSVDEFNQFADLLNNDADAETSAAAVGDDAVLEFGADGTIIITGGADLFA